MIFKKTKYLSLALVAISFSSPTLSNQVPKESQFHLNLGENPPAPPLSSQYSNTSAKGEDSFYPPVKPVYKNPYQNNRQYTPTIRNDEHLWDEPNEATYEAINKMTPVSPDMIRLHQRRMDEIDRARGGSFRPLKKKKRNIVYGSSNQFNDRVFVFQGHASTLVFLDSFGKPWQVQRYIVGNKEAYSVVMDNTPGNSHILTLVLKRKFVPSNLTILLEGRNVPIVLDLESDNHQIDSLITITSSGASAESRKMAKKYSEDLLIDVTANMAELVPFLNNTPPDNAIVVSVVDGLDTKVWYWNNRFICRTKGKLTNPVPLGDYSEMTSGDGVWTVYDLGRSIPPIFSILNGSGEFKQAIVAVDEVL